MKRIFLPLLLLCVWLGAFAQPLLPVPALTARVIDQTGTLDAAARQGLEDKLAALEQARGAQLVMLLVPTTQPEDIASYANRVANSWKIGRREVGDGVLLIVAKNDRKVRIEVAKTLEGALPDLAAKQIIDEAITPSFKQGDFAGGLGLAADRIGARIAGEALPEPKKKSRSNGFLNLGFDLTDLAIFLFFAVPIAGAVMRSIFGPRLGALLTAGGVGAIAMVVTASVLIATVAGVVALIFVLLSGRGFGPAMGSTLGSRSGWSSGGGFGGSGGGGGFSSGGGGDFGGGGASGDW